MKLFDISVVCIAFLLIPVIKASNKYTEDSGSQRTIIGITAICYDPKDVCNAIKPCKNEATCSPNDDDQQPYKCDCVLGYGGVNCEEKLISLKVVKTTPREAELSLINHKNSHWAVCIIELVNRRTMVTLKSEHVIKLGAKVIKLTLPRLVPGTSYSVRVRPTRDWKEPEKWIDQTSFETPAVWKSCKEAYDNWHREDKAYTLSLDSGMHQVYCHMSEIVGCGSGGFTLLMKIDGAKDTFLYDSGRWTNKEAYNVSAGVSGFDEQETKLSTYWAFSFSKVCLGMKVGNDLRFISIDQDADSLYSLIADGQYRATYLGRDAWKSLVNDSSLQRNCNKEGFNVIQYDWWSKARIGITSNEQNHCSSCDSRIGFGTGGYPHKTVSCGNTAGHEPDNGNKHTKAHGYILVQ